MEGTIRMSEKLTKEQAAIISAYTGVLCGSFTDMAEYVEKKLGRPVWTHEYSTLSEQIRSVTREDFLSICNKGEQKQ